MKKLTILTVIMLTVNLLLAQWIQQNPNFPDQGVLIDIMFVDENHGWAVGSNATLGTINGGYTWEACPMNGNSGPFFSVWFANQTKGWVAKYNYFLHTEDGGIGPFSEWVIQGYCGGTSGHYTSVFFTDTLNGWATGYSPSDPKPWFGIIDHTIDGGENWERQYDQAYVDLSDIFMINNSSGWVVGNFNLIMNTKDGGSNWTYIDIGLSADFHSVFFTDQNSGWIAGSIDEKGVLLHTTDNGENWEIQLGDTTSSLNDITFIDNNIGYIVGDIGTILNTSNGGLTWEFQVSGTTVNLNSVSFVDTENGWICGDSSIVLHTNNGGTVGLYETIIYNNSLEIFPNPSNGLTTIIFKLKQKESITLTIQNICGQEVKQISLGMKEKGQFDLDCSDYAPGIYFINLKTNNGTLTEKLIIE